MTVTESLTYRWLHILAIFAYIHLNCGCRLLKNGEIQDKKTNRKHMIETILIAAVALLYLKWLFCALLYPMEAGWALYQNHRGSKLCKLLAVPGWLAEHILRSGGGRFLIFNISTMPSVRLRRLLYKGLGAHIGPKAVLHFRTEIRAPWRLRIGKGSIIGDNAILDAREGLTIGRNVNLSSNVSIYTLQHDHRDPYFRCPTPQERKLSVEIGDRAWLGSNVTVLPGVSIGEGAVCCAGCVVTKDVEPYAVVAGIPAKKVGERPRHLVYEFDGKSCRLY